MQSKAFFSIIFKMSQTQRFFGKFCHWFDKILVLGKACIRKLRAAYKATAGFRIELVLSFMLILEHAIVDPVNLAVNIDVKVGVATSGRAISRAFHRPGGTIGGQARLFRGLGLYALDPIHLHHYRRVGYSRPVYSATF